MQDRNGRISSLIALEECMRNNIVPFLIEERKKLTAAAVFLYITAFNGA